MRRGDTGADRSVSALARTALQRGLDALAQQSTASAVSNGADPALRWLERAHRLVPFDPNTTLALASAWLLRDPVRAESLFESVANKYSIMQAWLGLAASRLRIFGADGAAAPMAVVLSRYVFAPDVLPLADAIGCRPGQPGWCALHSNGTLEIHRPSSPAPTRPTSMAERDVRVLLDGNPVRGAALPSGWESCRTIDVRIGNVPLLGSPILVSAIRRLAGCVEVSENGICGWAWHPADPETPPELTLLDESRGFVRRLIARDESTIVPDTGPLARPRSFRLTRADLPPGPGLIYVRGPDGKDLPGSPLDPFADEAAQVATALRLGQTYPAASAVSPTRLSRKGADVTRLAERAPTKCRASLRADAPSPPVPLGADRRKRAVCIVIPVHDGGAVVLACLESVLASKPDSARIVVVDDGSSDASLIAALDRMAKQRQITLLRHTRAQGFPAAANAGIRAAVGRDVALLNSDTLVPPGWLERLREAAYSSRDIGTVSPLSNDASILSYPGPAGSNKQPDLAQTKRLDRAASRANGRNVTDIPVGLGFCLYLRRDCLNSVGLFRDDLFAQGYGEENDLCLRARRLGWRNVALTGLFIAHAGGTSFGSSAAHLRARNGRIIEQLHPGYHALIDSYRARDPLAKSRRRIDLQLWRERGRKWQRAAILITHNDGGGVEQRLIIASKEHERAGRRPIVLRPAETAEGEPAIAVRDAVSDDLPNLIYAMPGELADLLRLLRAAKSEMIEVHHLADYPSAIYDLVAHLAIPYDVHVHDYAWFCPRISLVGANGRYCGEPDLPDCEACVTDNGHFLKEDISVAALRGRSSAFLASARRVVVPSDDTGTRLRRHFDTLSTITIPHEDDAATAPVPDPPAYFATRSSAARTDRGGRSTVCVVGAIGVHKGYDILLSCARDAVRRDLDLEFVVVGHTIDDARMLATGRVFVTGRFEPDEAVDLIVDQNAKLGFVTSICPETWCLSLGDMWRAGLNTAAFDIGAPAERIRKTGRGILLPLGLSSSAINNALVAAMRTVAQ